ncbi:hypothetical protein SmJEL517_g02698 [Synchytrium microbalum]|uniref:Methyltransferase type 11 domain-containing protein n=1 Tax=Synchytrium microbalum TaxID=1806994 RepID=A0A507BZL3_9FUNG|nr:uncharacterized protein SmJEL517_g02698 [Synchytrium microbalum]TPX34720.1 hypothetical protein SmJEL517_g02698 [Synchytrium microbalum]
MLQNSLGRNATRMMGRLPTRTVVMVVGLIVLVFGFMFLYSDNSGTSKPHLDIPTNKLKSISNDHDERENAFSHIYKNQIWGDGESRSGSGSYMSATVNVRKFLAIVFQIFRVRSWLDSPCGDCHWQWNITGFDKIEYTGLDIVGDVILADGRKHSQRPNMRFLHMDAAVDNLPPSMDVILCRDMIQHLPMTAGRAAVANFERSGAKYLVTNFHSANIIPETGGNKKITPGEFYYVDVMKAPFNFPPPLMYVLDGEDRKANEPPNFKMVGIWKLPALDQGNGTSILPINMKALEDQTVIVLDQSLVKPLQEMDVPYANHYS